MSGGERLVFDIEGDGLLDAITRVHCLCVEVVDTGEKAAYRAHDGSLQRGLERLRRAGVIIGHNIIRFDLPALKKVLGWEPAEDAVVLDTLPISRAAYPTLRDWWDPSLMKRGILPGRLFGRYSLEAWGYRLGMQKVGVDITDWSAWTQYMEDRCLSDVGVNATLFRLIEATGWKVEGMLLEQRIRAVCDHMEAYGFPFDIDAAEKLVADLEILQVQLTDELRDIFQPWWMPVKSTGAWADDPADAVVTPKKPRSEVLQGFPPITKRRWSAKTGRELKPYVGPPRATYEGPYTRVKLVEFNPGSRAHVANRLQAVYGWVPEEFSFKTHEPKVDDEILRGLPWPEAQQLARLFLVQKRLGQISVGAEAWFKGYVKETGCVHPRYDCNGGTNTGRAAHKKPNISQTPRVNTKKVDGEKVVLRGEAGGWGWEARSCWIAKKGEVLVGCDVASLELRTLAHYLFGYDGGVYAETVDGGDPHTWLQELVGLPTRDNAKTLIYAYIYGAQDPKLGEIVGGGEREGRELRATVARHFPALPTLIEHVELRAQGYYVRPESEVRPADHRSSDGLLWMKNQEAASWLRAVDGRPLRVRWKKRRGVWVPKAPMNLINQSAGALICKEWVASTYEACVAEGMRPGRDFAFAAWSHDEIQARLPEDTDAIETYSRIIQAQAPLAGERLGIRCPIRADTPKVGRTWADTH